MEDQLRSRWPSVSVDRLTRASQGDRDRRIALWQAPDRGLFTTDLSEALLAGEADIAVHSWKDLPISGFPGTVIAGTLERADPRDVLIVHRDALINRPGQLRVLTSSPRRAWQMEQGLAPLLPWRVESVAPVAVRGNVPTRLGHLNAGAADALVVAKAALDRLLHPAAGASAREAVRSTLERHRWMVLPLRDFPTAPAQGALALEVPADRPDLIEVAAAISHEQTRRAVDAERGILSGYGGGCHEAIGATVLMRAYGTVTSVSGRTPESGSIRRWSLEPSTAPPPRSTAGRIWPRPEERHQTTRQSTGVTPPTDQRGWWVTRADAVPDVVSPDPDRIVWAAGLRTWRRLAHRGFWVNGCADGLGDTEHPAIDALAGRTVAWWRLTHTGSRAEDCVATYTAATPLPADLELRTHFFWTSGATFLDAIRRYPGVSKGWHGCGPGRTSQVVYDSLGDRSRVSIWLDYEQWHQHVTPS